VGAARKSYGDAMRLAEKTGYAQALSALESNLSNLERRIGTIASALEHAARAVEFARQAEDPSLEASAEENLGEACAARGETDEAQSHLSRAMDIAQSCGNKERVISARLRMLEVSGPDGKVGGADGEMSRANDLDSINEALRQIQEHNYADLLPRAWRLKARPSGRPRQEQRANSAGIPRTGRDAARDGSDFFEELESWKALRQYHTDHGRADERARCGKRIEEMTGALER